MRRRYQPGRRPAADIGSTAPPRKPTVAGVLLAPLLVSGCALVGGADTEFDADGREITVDPMEVATRVIDDRDIGSQIRFLASDEMRGRATPGPELDRAAAWVAERLREVGVQPAGEHGGFIQLWPVEDTVHAPNVVGVLPGADPALSGEYVIVTAHVDHLGVGEPNEDGDSIYNGADDNASGVAAMLEVAEAFGGLPRRPPRPLLFVAFSGEEEGLLGSRRFAEEPTVILSEAVAVLNLDMVGRNHPDTVGVVGHGYSTLGPLVERIASEYPGLGLTVDTDPVPDQDLFRRSDHYPLARLGIPALAVTTSLHDDYHQPDDEAGAIDVAKATRVARLVFLAAYALATEGITPEWTDSGRRAIQ